MIAAVRSEVADYEASIGLQFDSFDKFSAASSRLQFLNFAYRHCSAQVDVTDLELIYSELVANVMKHAPGLTRVAAYVAVSGHVTLVVTDTGPAFALKPSLPIDPLSTAGRGLYIISQLCDEVTLLRFARGNQVSARLCLVPEPRLTFHQNIPDLPAHLITRFRCSVRR